MDENIIQKKLRQLKTMGFPHYQPLVPRQDNMTDCGLYLLQYVELFAESEEYILNNREVIYLYDLTLTSHLNRILIKRNGFQRY